MAPWTKMTELLENCREAYESISRHKVETKRKDASRMLREVSSAKNDRTIVTSELFPADMPSKIVLADPLRFKFLYGSGNHKLEIHMEIEWIPRGTEEARRIQPTSGV